MDEWLQIVNRAWVDDTFKQELIADPSAKLKQYNIPIPAGVTFVVVEDQISGVRHLVLPPKPDKNNPRLSVDDFGRDAESGDPGF